VSVTLLIDLDNTLLDNSMHSFLPAYLKLISEYVAPYAEPSRVVNAILAGSQRMLDNRNPACSLSDVFFPAFYPEFSESPQVMEQVFDRFYQEVFPQLSSLTRPRPEAIELIESAFARGYKVAIATNPLFPRTAILQRLSWAGLPVEKYPFDLIPSMETFHFAKPNPACLAEILAQLGWPEAPAIMVGDDPKNDLSAASALGIPSFAVTQNGMHSPSEMDASFASGDLDDLLPWLDRTPKEELLADYSDPQAILAILHATPAALNTLCTGAADEAWVRSPQPGEWVLTQIMCHLRDVDSDVNLPRMKSVIRNNNPFLPGIDTDRWADERGYITQDGRLALRQFNIARIQLLELLERLSPQEWGLPVRHAIFGPTTLHELVSIIVGHDQLHIRQAYHLINTSAHTAA